MISWRKFGIGCVGAALLAAGPGLSAVKAAAADTGWTASRDLYEIRTLAGTGVRGDADGAAAAASLFHPSSIAELGNGRLLVADKGNQLLRAIDGGQVSKYGGVYVDSDASGLPLGAYRDDALGKAAFNEPSGLAAGADGTVYVADSGNNAVRRIAPDGTVTTLAGNGLIGDDDGKGQAARFDDPSDVAVDAQGNVYVADTRNNAIRKIAADGTVTTLNAASDRVVQYAPGAVEWAGDYADGPIASAKFNEPSGLALDGKGNLYVSDTGNQRIRYIDFAAGTVTTVAGTAPAYSANSSYAEGGYADGAALSARFNAPEGLAVAPDGTLLIADSLNHAVRMLKDGQVTTLAGEATEYGSNDGVTYAARFDHPTDVAVLSDGRLAIADEFGNKVRVLTKYAKPAGLKANGTIRTLLNGSLVRTDVPAFQRGGATLLPLRSVGEALGYEVGYDAAARAGTLTKDGVTYAVKSGELTVAKKAGGQASTLKLNGAPVVKEGNLFVPVRFFADEAGLDVQWDAAESIVVLRTPSFE